MYFLSIASIALSLLITLVTSLPTISVTGQYFFTAPGQRWFVKGIAYQLVPEDPLLDQTQCQLDATLMKTLGANAIRVYHVDSGKDHSACMTIFEQAGIYLFVDLDTFDTQINQTQPMWTSAQQSRFEAVMDEFQKYDNTAGFFIGNEILTDGTHSDAAAYIKVATRALKAYRASKGYRNIPIGYSHADIAGLRPNLQNYLVCGDSSETIEFFGLNTYQWCGVSTYATSGYKALTDEVANYPVPIFISETGCITAKPRTFADQNAIFGPNMSNIWSGSIIYEWIQEENDYGLITYGSNTDALVSALPNPVPRSGTPNPMTPDFGNLMSQWATITPSASANAPSYPAPSCPASTAGVWLIDGDADLPSIDAVVPSGTGTASVKSTAKAGPTTAVSGQTTAASAQPSASKTAAACRAHNPFSATFFSFSPFEAILGFVGLLSSVAQSLSARQA